MKTRLLIIITGILTGMMMFAFDDDSNDAYGMWIPLSPEDLIEQSVIIFVGTVIDVHDVDIEYTESDWVEKDGNMQEVIETRTITLDEYTVSVEEYLKNPQDSDTMKVLRATVGGVPSGPSRISGFEIGDRVLFYLPKDETQTHFANQYLPESFQIPKHCDAKSVLEKPKIIGANDFRMMQDGIPLQDNFTANKSIQFVFDKDLRTLNGSGFTVDVAISKALDKKEHQTILEERIHAESKSCEWIATIQWDFVPTAGEYSMWMSYAEDGDSGRSTSSSGFSVVESFNRTIYPTPWEDRPPLKQLKYGIDPREILCNDELILIQKYDGSPACVKPETKTKLIERGWTATSITLENNSLTAEEEVALAQSHYDKMYQANLEKMELENANSTAFATEQAKKERILELEAIISNETKTLENLQTELQKKYALDPDFEKQKKRAAEILRSTFDSDDIPYLGMTLGEDRQSLVIGINSLKLTAEKDRQFYENYIAERFAEITYPITIVFHEPRGGDE